MGEVFFNGGPWSSLITSSWREKSGAEASKHRGPLLPPGDSVSALELGLGSHAPIQGPRNIPPCRPGGGLRCWRWSGGLHVDVKLLSVEG